MELFHLGSEHRAADEEERRSHRAPFHHLAALVHGHGGLLDVPPGRSDGDESFMAFFMSSRQRSAALRRCRSP